MEKIRVVFMGTPEFAVNILEGLISNYEVVLVVTQPDKEVGRHKEIKFSPIKELAIENNIPVFQPISIRNDYEEVISSKPDIIITCAYGQLIPEVLLSLPKYGCINVHASLLPKLRGGAPIHKAIMNGYDKTGITVMYMVKKMDAGDIISQEETIISDLDNQKSLHDRLSIMGRDLLLKTLPNIIDGNINPIKQEIEEVTFGYNITREEELIDLNKDIKDVFNQIRGLSPTPCAYLKLDGKTIKIYEATIGDQVYTNYKNGEIVKVEKSSFSVNVNGKELIVKDIQVEGKKRMLVKEYFNGIDSSLLLGKVFNL